ncbi:MAG: hypothetical protein ACREC5_07575 [Thermoplasmata archaeon]
MSAPDPSSASAEELLGRVDPIFRKFLGTRGPQGLYAGPWWPLTGPAGAGRPLGWKCAVLRRRPTGGAEHWGHLYLVPATAEEPRALAREGGFGSDPAAPELSSWPAAEGPDAPRLLARARTIADGNRPLLLLAGELARALRARDRTPPEPSDPGPVLP